MPAKNLYRERKEGIYCHIYNKGIEERVIFNDEEDYEVFLGFMKEYLTPPQDPESIKKSFMVHGRIFRGTPHLPKNYFNKVELIAYALMPCHFHLLLHQKARGSLESFIRSLCTRYSMYFNKKYKRTGALFEGPYKSVQIQNGPRLPHLTRYFHYVGGHSSYGEYLGTRETAWVKPGIILSFFSKGTADYKDFVEKYEPDPKVKQLLEGLTFESEAQHLERRDSARNVENYPRETPTQSSEKISLEQNLKPWQRIPEVLATTIVFLLLLTFGVRNVLVSTVKNPKPSMPSAVLSTTEEIKPTAAPSATGKIEPKKILTVKINDGAESVNIRQEPSVDSEKIGLARDGDTFDLISEDEKWYEIKLATRSGFISAAYAEIREENK